MAAIAAKANSTDVTTALSYKADKDGSYPEMSVGTAETSSVADNLKNRENSQASAVINFRPSGGTTDIGTGKAIIKKIKGKSILFNQLASVAETATLTVKDVAVSVVGHKITMNGTASGGGGRDSWTAAFGGTKQNPFAVTLYNGHKYAAIYSEDVSDYVTLYLTLKGNNNVNTYKSGSSIFTFSLTTGDYYLGFNVVKDLVYDNVSFYIDLIDLTEMFGAGNEPATVSDFKKYFPLDRYDFTVGKVVNYKGSSIKTVGFNAYDHASGRAELIGGYEYMITGGYTSLSFAQEGGSAVSFSPDADGRFTPAKNGVLTVTGGDNKTCVHLVWSGYRDEDREDYVEHTLDISGIYSLEDGQENLLFADGLCSVGTSFDEVTATKAVKRIGKRPYESGDEDDPAVLTDKTDTYYVLAEPITVNFSEPMELEFNVYDFGTEQILPKNGALVNSTPMYAEINYAMNAVDTIRRLPENYIGKESFEEFTSALCSAMASIGYEMSVSSEYDRSNAKYTFTVTISESEE